MDWSRLHPVAIAVALEERERDVRRLSRVRAARLADPSPDLARPERGALAVTPPECRRIERGGAGVPARLAPTARVGLSGKPTSR